MNTKGTDQHDLLSAELYHKNNHLINLKSKPVQSGIIPIILGQTQETCIPLCKIEIFQKPLTLHPKSSVLLSMQDKYQHYSLHRE